MYTTYTKGLTKAIDGNGNVVWRADETQLRALESRAIASGNQEQAELARRAYEDGDLAAGDECDRIIVETLEKCPHGNPKGGWVDRFNAHQTCGGCWIDAHQAQEAARKAAQTPEQRAVEIVEGHALNARRPIDDESERADMGIYGSYP